MYDYQTEKPAIFTPTGTRELLRVYKNILQGAKLLQFSDMTAGIYGSSWTQLAYIDYLVELGIIRLVAKGQVTQNHIYTLN